jgi:hypothetical protein
VSVLGSLWDTKEDLLSLGHRPMNLEKKVRGAKAPPKVDVSTPEGLRDAMTRGLVTRTTLASRVAEFYDPVGLFEPLKLALKLALSEFNALDWLDPIPADRYEVWVRLLTAMENSRELKLVRCIRPEQTSDQARLLCLADAAEHAGGCAIYVGYPLSDGSFSCRLVYARSRLMKNTVPRNELEAILLAAEASLTVRKALKEKVSEVFYFSDSTIAISWVLNSAKRLRMWTFNGVKEIMTALRWVIGSDEVCPLYHSAGDMNTADMVTRPVEPNAIDMSDTSAWQTGVAWMRAPSGNLPKDQPSIPQVRNDVELFERERFPDQILVAEEQQLLLEPDMGQAAKSSYLVTPPQMKDTWMTATVDFIRLGWKRAMKVVTAVVRFVEKLKHRLHLRRGERRDECPWCGAAPEPKIETAAHRAVMVTASQQAASIETKRRLDLEYQFVNGIWYSTQRLEKEGEPELRDLDGVPFFDKVSIKKLLPIADLPLLSRLRARQVAGPSRS